MTSAIDAGRADLQAFAAAQVKSYWEADLHFQRVLRFRAGEAEVSGWEDELERFGAEAAQGAEAAVQLNNRPEHLPALERWGPYGERIEAVNFHPSYHEAGALIYGSGVMAVLEEPAANLASLARFYLSAHNGEAGHNCPLACTAGVIKSLQALGDPGLQARFLPRLLSRDYGELAHGAQFLTEVQGGSDVGANAVRAWQDAEGAWRVSGEKWFCSNATADLILMTARPEGAPEGTAGLGLFLVPRRLEGGALNAYTLRRLKEKLGTRTMASAEIDFEGALAYPLGPLDQGFKNMMTHVITTSRVFNAVATAGAARRACLIAHSYAQRRRAFGPPIASYPLVQETLADMRAETAAMVSGTFQIIALLDRVEAGTASEEEAGFLRVAINLNKMRTAQSAHEVILSGIEILGGNGAIESFSALPRLLRDNVVYENWEGTHNVLLNQVLRDAQRLGVHRPFFAGLARAAEGDARLAAAVGEAQAAFDRLLAAPADLATLQMRALGGRLAWLQWALAMREDGSDPALIAQLLDRRVGPAAARDATYLARVAALSRAP